MGLQWLSSVDPSNHPVGCCGAVFGHVSCLVVFWGMQTQFWFQLQDFFNLETKIFEDHIAIYCYIYIYALWWFNIAIENGPFIVDLAIENGGSFHRFLYVYQAGYITRSPPSVPSSRPMNHVTPLVSSLRRKITGATEYFSRESLNWMTVRKTSKGQLFFPVDGPLRNPVITSW